MFRNKANFMDIQFTSAQQRDEKQKTGGTKNKLKQNWEKLQSFSVLMS